MTNKYLPLLAFILLLLIVAVRGTLFIVPESKQAVILRFGLPVAVRSDAGLHFKVPFINQVRYLEKRMRNWDGDPNQVPTKDKKYIWVDTTARYKIVDPLKYIQRLPDQGVRNARISAIINGAARDIISSHRLVEAVRNSNAILDDIAEAEAELARADEAGELIENVDLETTGEIEPVTEGRERVSEKILEGARSKLAELGIELVDVQLRRIAYEKSVEEEVYTRMISERKEVIDKIISIGQGEVARIRGKTDKELQEIQSGAYRKVQEVRGAADAQAVQIYADAVGENTEFYRFLRTTDAYRKGLRNDITWIMSSDSEFWRLLREGPESID